MATLTAYAKVRSSIEDGADPLHALRCSLVKNGSASEPPRKRQRLNTANAATLLAAEEDGSFPYHVVLSRLQINLVRLSRSVSDKSTLHAANICSAFPTFEPIECRLHTALWSRANPFARPPTEWATVHYQDPLANRAHDSSGKYRSRLERLLRSRPTPSSSMQSFPDAFILS